MCGLGQTRTDPRFSNGPFQPLDAGDGAAGTPSPLLWDREGRLGPHGGYRGRWYCPHWGGRKRFSGTVPTPRLPGLRNWRVWAALSLRVILGLRRQSFGARTLARGPGGSELQERDTSVLLLSRARGVRPATAGGRTRSPATGGGRDWGLGAPRGLSGRPSGSGPSVRLPSFYLFVANYRRQ